MTNASDLLFHLIIWGLGLCFTGFCVLAGWIWKVQGLLKDMVTAHDLKESLDNLSHNIKKLEYIVQEMSVYIGGNIKTKGLNQIIEKNTEKIIFLEKRCEARHKPDKI